MKTKTISGGSALGGFGLALAAAAAFAPATSQAEACFIACTAAAPCAVGGQGATLAPGKTMAYPHCESLNAGAAGLEILPNAGKGCSYLDTACRRKFDVALSEGRSGPKFDSADFFPPMGEPCAIGFPCGTLLKPRDDRDLAFSLEDAGASGQLEIKAMRGATGSARVPVVQGRVSIPGRLLVRAASYSYSFKDGSGRAIGAGQFTVANGSMERDVREDIEEKSKTLRSKDLARIGALLANSMDWDAYQIGLHHGDAR